MQLRSAQKGESAAVQSLVKMVSLDGSGPSTASRIWR
jgi:hypothetical protein